MTKEKTTKEFLILKSFKDGGKSFKAGEKIKIEVTEKELDYYNQKAKQGVFLLEIKK